MFSEPDRRPSELNWSACPCGSKTCVRQHPSNLGTFYHGSGFEPHEVEWLNRAWALLVKSEKKDA